MCNKYLVEVRGRLILISLKKIILRLKLFVVPLSEQQYSPAMSLFVTWSSFKNINFPTSCEEKWLEQNVSTVKAPGLKKWSAINIYFTPRQEPLKLQASVHLQLLQLCEVHRVEHKLYASLHLLITSKYLQV